MMPGASIPPDRAQMMVDDLCTVLALAHYALEPANFPGFIAWLNAEGERTGTMPPGMDPVTAADLLTFTDAIRDLSTIAMHIRRTVNRGSN